MRWLIGIGIILGGMIYASNKYLANLPVIEHSQQYLNPPPMMEHFAFGYRELIADALWLRSIQDFDVCEKEKINNQACSKKWLGSMLLRTVEMAPHFRVVYALGPIVLCILLNDTKNAIELIDKSFAYFAEDWPILYRAGYIFLYEVEDKKRAAFYFERAAKNGAPAWVFSLAAKLYQESGEKESSEILLREVEKTGIPPEILKRMKNRIQNK